VPGAAIPFPKRTPHASAALIIAEAGRKVKGQWMGLDNMEILPYY